MASPEAPADEADEAEAASPAGSGRGIAAGRGQRTAQLVGWGAPAVVSVVLGLWRLTGPALWADELATWGAVRISWSQLWQLSGSVDVVLYPYYALMKAYTALVGTSTVAMRLPSVVAIAVATLAVTALGRRIEGPWLGLLAGLIFAVLPVTSRYAQEARSYSLVMCGSAVAVLCLIRLLEDPGRRRLAAYAVAVTAVGLLHPLNGLLMVAGHAAAVGWWQVEHRRTGWRTSLRWLAAAGVGMSPAVVLGALGARQSAQISWIKLVDLAALHVFLDRLFFSAAVGGFLLALAIVGARRKLAYLCLAGAAFVPIALLLAVGTQIAVWRASYVVAALPAMAVLAGSALSRLARPHAIAALCLVAVLGYPAQIMIRSEAGHSQASTRIANVIGPRYRPGDVVVFPDTHYSIPWSPRDIYERYLPAPRPPDVLQVAPQRTDGRFLARECPDASCLGTPPRIWVVRADNSTDPLKDMAGGKRQRIGRDYRPVQRWQYSLLGITLMERSGPHEAGH
ncbi:glycosyltransferase family 39 protein [Plantactinospora siamensis]|uniref:Glycosyltransferase family 39 protein n=1 Tax=Plantactinospora siamensis TaxID=555372 RepID=A0ABV6NVS6_9ACTN